MGRILFYLLWPLVWIYAPLTRRVRVVIMHDGMFVAVKNSFGPGIWQFPGGGIKFGESVEAAAIREVAEELGLHINKVTRLHQDIKVVHQFGLLMRYHFVYIDLNSAVELQISKELTAVKWLEEGSKEWTSKEVKMGLSLARQQG